MTASDDGAKTGPTPEPATPHAEEAPKPPRKRASRRKSRAKPRAEPGLGEAADPPPEYSVGRWNRKPLYDCTRCSYNTLREEDIERHVRLSHAPTTSGKE